MKTIKIIKTACLLFLCLSNLAWATKSEQGKTLYQTCAACHGDKAQGNTALNAPALAGQYQWYLARQLNNFKSGLRGQHEQDPLAKQMLPFVSQLSKTDIAALSNYLSELTPQPSPVELKGDIKNGFRYYQSKCGACHGDAGQGNPSFNAPKLSGLSGSYLKRQMNNFSQGVRGYDNSDKLGRQMALMARMTSGQELDDILYFLSSQGK